MSSGYRSRLDALAAAFLLVAAACDRPESPAQARHVTIQDSVGIQIVDSHSPQWDEGTAWTVASEPVIAIGGYTSTGEPRDSSQLVWDIRDVVPLSDGRIAMLSRGEKKVFVFESSGTFSTSIGRVGQGPGEYRYPDHLQLLPGDTLVIWDVLGPVAYFDPTGELLRDWRVDVELLRAATHKPNQISPERAHLPLADGSFIVLVGLGPGNVVPPLGVAYRVPVEFFRIDSTYTAHSLGRWEEREHIYLHPWGPPGLPFPFGVQLAAGGTPTAVYISNTDQYEVHRFSTTGVLQRIIRRTAEPIPITAGDIQEWKDGFPRYKDWWSNWDRAMEKLPPREFRPPIAGLLVDSRGYLWVMDSYRLDRSGSEWSIFDPAGHWRGTLEIPLGRVEWVGEDLILGVSQDPDTGVQVVKGYRLNRNPEGPSGP